LPDPAQTYLVGVSGGRDSMAMLQWLLDAGCRQLVVCHLDHGIRSASAADAAFVKAHAHILRLPEFVEREEVRGPSLEAAARDARYRFFARAAKSSGCNRVLLAHHADDQVETFLFNLLRGGPSAMKPSAVRTVDGTEMTLIRPFLGVWREEIDAFIAEHRVPFCEDESNADTRFTRNRLRHEGIPALGAAMGRDVRRSIWRAAEILSAEDDFLSGQPELQSPPRELEVATLRALPLALRRRLVHAWLRSQGIGDVGFEVVESVLALLDSKVAKTNLPGNRCARRRAKRIFVAAQ
jgi:tRNA(Ile)-lysidine synthase